MVKKRSIAILLTLAVAFGFAITVVGSNTVFADEDIDLVIKKLNQSKRILKNKVLPRLSGSVSQTGQTTPYAPGDDGDLQKGTPWPNPRFTDNGDGTVTDLLTDLIWLKNANCFGERTWTEALDDCNTLADGQCGVSDSSAAGEWRLPNVKELQSLITRRFLSPVVSDAAGTGPWTEGDPFTNVQVHYYWSATTYTGDIDKAWIVSMNIGIVFNDDKFLDGRFVWPVRAGR
jgi:hypothetical protein